MKKENVSNTMNKSQQVIIHIISEQWVTGQVLEPMKFMTTGLLTHDEKNDEWTVSYDESEATGMTGTKTSLRLTKDGHVHFIRTGSVQMDVLFESGNHFLSQMETPFGLLDISILTNEVKGNLSEQGGELSLGYSLNVPQQEKISTKLNLTVAPKT
ncbi:MAG TPA: DUF1934 domain-containing protein [Clostridiaceae bacterium]|nr:DUF1934 domain-containing protein [Clostridiaceae bacterium]